MVEVSVQIMGRSVQFVSTRKGKFQTLNLPVCFLDKLELWRLELRTGASGDTDIKGLETENFWMRVFFFFGMVHRTIVCMSRDVEFIYAS